MSDKKRHRKPTTPFGYFTFSKAGSVASHIEQLPPDKSEQEIRVGEAFVKIAPDLCGEAASVNPLNEDGHDFLMLADGKPNAEVQCTEIVFHDFLAPRGLATRDSILVDGVLSYVDVEMRNGVLEKKISQKLAKNYSKPANREFWLLIWSVTGCFDFYEARRGGKVVIPESVRRGRAFVRKNGPGPFDKIFVFSMLTRPTIIWPL